ncbi:4HBT-2 domain containing protein [Pyrenophora tritici-repentis]|uniref:4HBT-2 domain containing protein n=1 Tax=Pyrenophora tritici-repentis TaxID=45151 RepID=A0A5M9KSZ8_9PLEO|nr:4HBT-2 domain-containing protein [Pyrenophora tritici-repentis]KAF7445107.1 4HBT-2 domain containing protein [Pyrenophora tritici-repentis]KAF7565376.1 4HBT-2 domain containing protein [Pyrenophora tritici-repentis]KAG9380486.1 4HBT-2 domain containing protein [Pyrenophora tritici-repentis]KAI0590793.1 4HBT-2 domain-containing protein [Pyrenophora tritici-repentis]
MRVLVRSGILSSRPTLTLAGLQRVPLARYQSTASDNAPATAALSPRWLSDVRARIGKCINFGMNSTQIEEAGSILQETTTGCEYCYQIKKSTDKHQLTSFFKGENLWPEAKGSSQASSGEVSTDRKSFGEKCMVGHPTTCHVNNVMYNRYAESARVNWTLNFAASDPQHKAEWMELMTPKSIGLILRSIKTDYKFPMKWPDRITVLHKLRDNPTENTDHFILDVLILSEAHRRPAARCVEDIVVYDYQTAKKSSLPPFMISKFQETFRLQEQAKETNSNRVRALLNRVRGLERSSWDRTDAKEDFGSVAGQ